MTQVRVGSQLRCPYCHDALVGVGRKAGCESCFAWHHAACMAELGRCGNCGAQAALPRKERSLEFERARLNELLAKGCVHQGCHSIETIPVGASYLCRRHAQEQSFLLWGVGVSLALASLVVVAFGLLQTRLAGDDQLALILMAAFMLVPAGFAAWRARSLGAAIRASEVPADAEELAEKETSIEVAVANEARRPQIEKLST